MIANVPGPQVPLYAGVMGFGFTTARSAIPDARELSTALLAALDDLMPSPSAAAAPAKLDEWLRHRLRAVQLKQWKRGTTMFRELRKLGATPDLAARIAGNAKRWWRNSAMGLNRVLPIAYVDRLGVPRFS